MFTDKKRLLKSLFVCAGALSFVHASVPIASGYIGATKLDETNTSVRISFEDNSTNEDGFYISIHNYTDNIPFATIEVDSTNGDHGYANITGLTCDKTYQATVIAYNEDGNSTGNPLTSFNMQSTFNATCGNSSSPETPLQPGPYIGVTSLDNSPSAVRVNFKDNSDNEDGFRIFDGAGIDITIPANDRTVHPDVYVNLTGLTCTQIYGLQAVAYKGTLESLPTPIRTFRIGSTFNISCDGNSTSTNQAPVANAGNDRTIALEDEGTPILLDGSASYDPDSDPITYNWSFISKPVGSSATLDDNTITTPSFIADIEGIYSLQLIVNDGQIDSVADGVKITVTDSNGSSPVPECIDPTTLTPQFD